MFITSYSLASGGLLGGGWNRESQPTLSPLLSAALGLLTVVVPQVFKLGNCVLFDLHKYT